MLWVQCDQSGELNIVPTGKSHIPFGKQKPVYDINTKHASAMIHTGIGSLSLSRYIATLNIPPMTLRNTKKREREIGPQVGKFAKSTCEANISQEVELSGGQDNNDEQPTNLTASFDMGWQSKGSGKSYASKSGHAVLIGKNSGKILNYATRITNCKQCEKR